MSTPSVSNASTPGAATLDLYPEIKPSQSAWLPACDGHEVYFEQCGNPDGLPVVFLHGGPAGGLSPRQRRFFDPSRYRICLIDQRGCGQSRPYGERSHNHTDMLIDRLGLQDDRVPRTYPTFGNTGPASVPTVLSKEVDAGRVKSGDQIILTGMGSGLNASAVEVIW